MSLGIPCISTNVGDIQLIIGNTGFISSTLSSVSLYDQIILALSSLDQYDRLSLLSRSRISSLFSISKYSKSFVELYSLVS